MIYRPFIHNPFLTVVTMVVILLSIFSLGLWLQFATGYQSAPPVEFILFPFAGAFMCGFTIQLHPQQIQFLLYGVSLRKVHVDEWRWVQIKPKDKLQTLQVVRDNNQRLTMIVRKHAHQANEVA